MVFNSFFFLLVFLPLVLAGWFGLNRFSARSADLFLIGMSLWFYGSFNVWYLPVLGVSAVLTYLTGRGVSEGRKWSLVLGIVLNLALLACFKYIPDVSRSISGENSFYSIAANIGLPVGLSFYTFSQIFYLVDLWKREAREEGFLTYCLYITYFPKISEGPITRYEEIVSQFRDGERRKPDAGNLLRGFILLFLGMAKKLLIADVLAPAASFGLHSAYYLDTLSTVVTMSCYALQLYYDFSGFCDMAMGVSRMLNIELPLNFDAPYHAETFDGFWRQWHKSLTRFFTRCVYIPLGGSRHGTARTCLNIMIVFVLSAVWHGTGITYLLWGVMTGGLVILSRIVLRDKIKGRIFTFALFSLTLIFFSSPDLSHSLAMLRNLFRPLYPGWLYRLGGTMDSAEFWLLNKLVWKFAPSLSGIIGLAELLVVMAAAMFFAFRGKTAASYADTMNLSIRNAVLMGILTVWCLTSLSGVTAYLYFKF